MVKKHFIVANELLQDSYHLGHLILDSGFTPNYLVGGWRRRRDSHPRDTFAPTD